MLKLNAQEAIDEITANIDEDGYVLVSQQHSEDWPMPVIVMDPERALAVAEFILEKCGKPKRGSAGGKARSSAAKRVNGQFAKNETDGELN